MNHNVINKEIKNLCVLGKFNGYEWSSKALSRDHKPSEPDEMNRILKNEGKVESFRDNNVIVIVLVYYIN